MSMASAKSTVQRISNTLFYGVAGRHVAGQHSLVIGEIIAIAVVIFCMGKVVGFKSLYQNKWLLIALIAMIAAYCIW